MLEEIKIGSKFNALVEFEVTKTDKGARYPWYLSVKLTDGEEEGFWVSQEAMDALLESNDPEAKRVRIQGQIDKLQKQLIELEAK